MQIKNKKQIISTITSVLVSTFLVAGVVFAVTTIGADGISFTTGNAGTLINANAAAAHASIRGIFIGEDTGLTGSAIPLSAATWATAQGNAMYCEDNNVALTGYTECFTPKMLITHAVATGDVSTTAIHPDLEIAADYTGTGGLSAIWGNTTIDLGTTVNLTGSLGDVGGGSFGLDVKGTLASGSYGTGVSVGIGGNGTNSGIITGFRIRGATGTVDWDGILSIEIGDGSWTGMTKAASNKVATMTNSPKTGDPAYWLKIYIGTTAYYFPVWTN
jgi:hypothetical protein